MKKYNENVNFNRVSNVEELGNQLYKFFDLHGGNNTMTHKPFIKTFTKDFNKGFIITPNNIDNIEYFCGYSKVDDDKIMVYITCPGINKQNIKSLTFNPLKAYIIGEIDITLHKFYKMQNKDYDKESPMDDQKNDIFEFTLKDSNFFNKEVKSFSINDGLIIIELVPSMQFDQNIFDKELIDE